MRRALSKGATSVFKDPSHSLEDDNACKEPSTDNGENNQPHPAEEDIDQQDDESNNRVETSDQDARELYVTAPEVPEHHELPRKDSRASVAGPPAGYDHGRILLSEPEEYWDDEEYEEDDDYTTARSYRSRGDNTTGGATTVLFPQYSQQVRRELTLAKRIVESTRSFEDIEDEHFDTSMVAEYSDDIFAYMKEQEVS